VLSLWWFFLRVFITVNSTLLFFVQVVQHRIIMFRGLQIL
jgi:hypothetical protein